MLRLILQAVLLLFPGCVGAMATLTDEKVVVELGKKIDILIDSSGALNIDDVTSLEYSPQFRPSQETVPNLGFGVPVVWARLKVKNITFTESWIFQTAFSDMDHVELYIEDGSNWEVQELGQALPFSLRKIVNRNLLFHLSLPFGKENTFFLRYHNEAGMTLPLKLFSSQKYQGHALGVQFVFGILFGFMLVLSLYNLILYLKVRESGYLFYFQYGVGYGLFQFSLYGLANQYLWPGMTWWAGHHVYFFLAFAIFCRILFTMSVLESKVNASREHKVMKWLLVAWIFLAAYSGLAALDLLPSVLTAGKSATLGIAAIYFLTFFIAVLAANIRYLRKKLPAAKTFMLALFFMVAGLILYAFKSLGILPSNFITEYGMLFGSVGEMCLLFVSLGERIQAIKSEAQDGRRRQQEAIHAYQEEQIRSIRLELELLKANIQPHFMLNSINAVIVWMREDPETAERLLHALSRELKLLLRIVGEKLIPISEEIMICRMHLEVMSLRHDKRFTLSLVDIQPEERIPPLVFHTLVENGLTHGYAGKEMGEFTLSQGENEEGITFTLFNDSISNTKSTGSGGLGLKYVRARLEEAYGRNWQLDSHSVDGGWRVIITIKKQGIRANPEGRHAHINR